MDIRGVFSTYDLTSEEKDTFADYLQYSMNNPILEFVKYLLGDDYLRFIDIMSGSTFKVPSSKTLERDLLAVRMFVSVKKNGFTEESIRVAAKEYGKTLVTSKRYIYKVAKVLGVEDTLEGDDLNNYIMNIKSIEEKDEKKDDSENESIDNNYKEVAQDE